MAQNMIEKLESYLKIDPKDTFTRFALALEYIKLDNLDKACRLFEEIVADDPDYVGTYYHLGGLYYKLKRAEDAIHTYRQGMEIAKKSGDQHALSELQAALLELDPDDD